jgi:hypothetical protein
MKIKAIIDSGLLESYILGTASEKEIALLPLLIKEHPQLLKTIESIEVDLIDFSSRQSGSLSPILKSLIAVKIFGLISLTCRR